MSASGESKSYRNIEIERAAARWSRRRFLTGAASGVALGPPALASLLGPRGAGSASASASASAADPAGAAAANGLPGLPHHAPRARRVIYLFQSGGPSQMDLFDPKPEMARWFDKDLPESIRGGQRLTTMTSGQSRFPIAPSRFKFERRGESGAWISELMPRLAEVADDICWIKSVHTEHINHDPAITFCQTGFQLAGRPSLGAWASYGLGSENADLPAFVVMTSRGGGRPNCQPLYDRLWGAGFLPSRHQGVRFMGVGDPVLYLSNPDGVDPPARRRVLDDLAALNGLRAEALGDPEIDARVAQYELAFRMQTSVPELADLSDESPATLELYGPDVRARGSYAWNCLMARRLAERGVRFVQLFHMGWDQHEEIPKRLAGQCRDTDQPTAALLKDLKSRGLLDDTLVVWGGEFGRTIYCQGKLTETDYGRDHHPRCFTVWMAGGGVRAGHSHGETDEFSYNVVKDPVHVHDLNATILHLLGVNHERLTFKFQGRHYRLTDVHGTVVRPVLA